MITNGIIYIFVNCISNVSFYNGFYIRWGGVLKIIVTLCVVCFALVSGATLLIDNQKYVKASIGLSMYRDFKQGPKASFQPYTNNSPHADIVSGIAGGIRFNQYLSGELDFQYRNMDYTASGLSNDKQNIRNYSVLSNIYIYKPWHGFNPFLLAGIGYSRNNNGNMSITPVNNFPTVTVSGKNTNNFIWNVGVGNSIEINKHYNFDILYRYIDLGKVKTKTTPGSFKSSTQKLRANEIMMSIIYKL